MGYRIFSFRVCKVGSTNISKTAAPIRLGRILEIFIVVKTQGTIQKNTFFCRSSGTTVKRTPIANYGDVSISSTWSFRLTGLQVPYSLDPKPKQRAPTFIPSSHFFQCKCPMPKPELALPEHGVRGPLRSRKRSGLTFV